MIKAQRKSEQLAIEAREREARELASSDALAGEMEAMTELFEQLSTMALTWRSSRGRLRRTRRSAGRG